MASPDEPRLLRIEALLDKIHYSIVGNGDPGLNERVRTLERNQEARDRDALILRRALIGITVTGAGAILVFVIRLMGVIG